jgi:hypothetical protein
MLITITRCVVICQSVAEVQLNEALSHRFVCVLIYLLDLNMVIKYIFIAIMFKAWFFD